ncbi:MAG: hypothetical protein RDV48_21725 [Candidatus Eremiobacteraeota bacterium]|nr:hypothetical protein [Candidatus Eremiobacteraeota bacterium]
MTQFPAKKNSQSCTGALYHCKRCGNVGCDHIVPGTCTKQGFRAGSCMKCRAVDKKEPLKA